MGRYLKDREIKSTGYAIRLPVGGDSLKPTAPVVGQIRYNTDNNWIEAYYNSGWNRLAKEGYATIVKDAQDGTATGTTLAISDGVRTTFTMSKSYASGRETQVIVVVGNIFQNPGVAYTFNGTTTITFTTPPPLGQPVIILHGYTSTIATISP